MRKTLSSGQKWFLRPYFPLIRGMFVIRSDHPSGHLSVGHTGHAAGRAEAREDLVNYMERVVGKIFS